MNIKIKRKPKAIAEFGDFQTPQPLANTAALTLAKLGIHPHSILEPTCGQGAFIRAVASAFPKAKMIMGLDINGAHLEIARAHHVSDPRIQFQQSNFFTTDWESIFQDGRNPWLIVGNPPWVTSAELSSINSQNVPEKSNFHGRSGIDAITGKSNFDISEWMLLRYLDWLASRSGALAVLCKTTVARKILLAAWKRSYPIKTACIYKIDALTQFGAAVDACFFVIETEKGAASTTCALFESLDAPTPVRTVTYYEGHLIADAAAFQRGRSFFGPEENYVWRSGIKHDCSKVMELQPEGCGFENGFGEKVFLEDQFLYPLLKSSDIGNGRTQCRSVMVVTQQRVGEDTQRIKMEAPNTWQYLQQHAKFLNSRGSSIYRNKPPFSIFGIGSYSFAPWKVAISGFYKHLRFVAIGPVDGKPIVLDDTVNFLPCASEPEAMFLSEILNSGLATDFFHSMVSWDEKRPITIDLLKRLSIRKVAAELGREHEYLSFIAPLHGPLFAPRKSAA